jgi:hypothetical protein
MTNASAIAHWVSALASLKRNPKVRVRKVIDAKTWTAANCPIDEQCARLDLILDPCVAPTLMLAEGGARLTGTGWQQYAQHAMHEVLGVQSSDYALRVERSNLPVRLVCALPKQILDEVHKLKSANSKLRLSLEPLLAAGWALLPRAASLPPLIENPPRWLIFASDRSYQLVGMTSNETRLHPPMPRPLAESGMESRDGGDAALDNNLPKLIEQTATLWGWDTTIGDFHCIDFARVQMRALTVGALGTVDTSVRIAEIVSTQESWLGRWTPRKASA